MQYIIIVHIYIHPVIISFRIMLIIVIGGILVKGFIQFFFCYFLVYNQLGVYSVSHRLSPNLFSTSIDILDRAEVLYMKMVISLIIFSINLSHLENYFIFILQDEQQQQHTVYCVTLSHLYLYL